VLLGEEEHPAAVAVVARLLGEVDGDELAAVAVRRGRNLERAMPRAQVQRRAAVIPGGDERLVVRDLGLERRGGSGLACWLRSAAAGQDQADEAQQR
jgi:hypothetical protein